MFNVAIGQNELAEKYGDGLQSYQEKDDMLALFGKCTINVDRPSYLKIFADEILTPYYLFQYFSILLWIVE